MVSSVEHVLQLYSSDLYHNVTICVATLTLGATALLHNCTSLNTITNRIILLGYGETAVLKGSVDYSYCAGGIPRRKCSHFAHITSLKQT